MEAQYKQFEKNGGKFILQQIARKNQEQKYQIKREMLIAALFYQDFIRQFIETQDIRVWLLELIHSITTTLPDNIITQATNDPGQHETLLELQLRRDKELTDKEEDKKYQAIKQTLLPVIQ